MHDGVVAPVGGDFHSVGEQDVLLTLHVEADHVVGLVPAVNDSRRTDLMLVASRWVRWL